MTWHVIGLAGPDDHFEPALRDDDVELRVAFGTQGDDDAISWRVPSVLAEYGLTPPVNAVDLLCAAVTAYTADVRCSRRSAYDQWTRDIALYVAVRDPAAWNTSRNVLERLLRFLTGDHWTVHVRAAPESYDPLAGARAKRVTPLSTRIACLFSGGLDSFIGALDLLAKGEQIALVGHHSLGGGPTSRSQGHALKALHSRYSEDQAPFLRFWVSPPKGMSRQSEQTTRGRSIMFLGLGIVVASALDAGRLVVPENGLISLNVPLTDARLGSFSTRTTHPYLVGLLRDLLLGLAIDVEVELPYRFLTKGEMIQECASQTSLQEGLSATMSCAHPGAGRFTDVRDPNRHCGYCVPCLIRRAACAVLAADPTPYAVTDLGQDLGIRRGSDLRAFRIALNRLESRPPRIGDVLASGPLPGSAEDIQSYLGVYRRGMEEVRRLLGSFS